MSRSYKLPIFKDKGIKNLYHRIVKRRIRNYLKSNFFNLRDKDFHYNAPNPKTIVNDYNYCDYVFDERWKKNSKLKIKFSRK